MKISILALLAVASITSAWAGFTPVPGSCKREGSMGPSLCSCDLASTLDPSCVFHSDNVTCGGLKCVDFKDGDTCGDLKMTTCALSNPRYDGECIQTINYDPVTVSDALKACQHVQLELNTQLSLGFGYCMSTRIRGGWSLDSVN